MASHGKRDQLIAWNLDGYHLGDFRIQREPYGKGWYVRSFCGASFSVTSIGSSLLIDAHIDCPQCRSQAHHLHKQLDRKAHNLTFDRHTENIILLYAQRVKDLIRRSLDTSYLRGLTQLEYNTNIIYDLETLELALFNEPLSEDMKELIRADSQPSPLRTFTRVELPSHQH